MKTPVKKGASPVKKISKPQAETPDDTDHPAPVKVCGTAEVVVIPRPRRIASPQQIFAIAPGVDTRTLLKQACDTLASLTALLENFAAKLDGPNRGEIFSIQQLAMVAELLVTQVRDNLAADREASAGEPETRH
jgi:hypothetical protein